MADEPQEPDDWLQDVQESDGEAGSGLVAEQESGEAPEPASPWAVKLDNWGKRKGRDLLKEEAFSNTGLAEEDLADLFGMSFNFEPELEESCADPVKAEYIKALQENPEYQALHNDTQLDTLASEIASLKYGEEYTTFRKKREEQHQKDKQDPTGKSPSPQEQLRREMEALSAANRAAKEAASEVQEFRDMQESMGIGKESGGGGQVPPQQMKQLFLKLKNDATLKAICEAAGKFRLLARSKQRNKVIHGYDDMVGVVFDNDISRMLAHELAMMGDEDLEADAVRRFVEKQTLCRDYNAVKKIAKGPVIFAIDESGSMSGPKIVQAKAMALAMAWVAKAQNRWCGLVGWSSKNQVRWMALPPGNWPTGELLKWLSAFLNGGTHLPIEKMPEIYEQLGAQRGKTDIVIITDGEAEQNSPEAIQRFADWKKQVSAKVIGISIQENSKGLKTISDDYYQIRGTLSVTDEAVGKALSI